MPRTWKSALAPFLAGIPERTGFVGEGRFILLNDPRWGERKLERMIDRKVALALPRRRTRAGALSAAAPRGACRATLRRGARGAPSQTTPVVALGPATVGPGTALAGRNATPSSRAG